jgi:hypothetical protein
MILTTNSKYKKISKDIGGNLADDLYQEVIIIFLEMKESTIEKINNIDFYFVRSMINLYRSKQFKKKYVSSHHEISDNITETPTQSKHDQEIVVKLIADELKKMELEYKGNYPYNVNLFRAYVSENCNFRRLQRITDINWMTSFNEIKKVKHRLKKRIENDL